MVTLGQIQLRGFCTIDPSWIRILLESYTDSGKNYDQWSMRQTLELCDAYLTVTECTPTILFLHDFIAFRGFMNAEIGLSEENTKDIASRLCEILIYANVSNVQASLVLHEPQIRCNEKYLACKPSKAQLLTYQSLFSTKEPGCPVYVDFASLGSTLSTSSLQCLSGALSRYFAPLSFEQAATDAGLIIGLAQGLLYENPGIDFVDIHYSANESTNFIGVARTTAEWQMHNSGYFRADVAENWKYVSAVILNFFVANNFLRLNNSGRQLLKSN